MIEYLTQNHDTLFTSLFDAEKNKTIENTPYFLQVKKLYVEYPEYPYLDNVTDWIMKKLGLVLDDEQKRNLKSLCYYAGCAVDKDKEKANKTAMIAAGWLILDKTTIDDALAQGKKLQVSTTSDNDWMTVKIDKIYKPHIFAKGTEKEQYGLMKPKARTHGYALYQFNNAFCKLV